MPESARWLIANGKLERAQMYLKKCAKMNQTEELIDTLKVEVSIFQMSVKSKINNIALDQQSYILLLLLILHMVYRTMLLCILSDIVYHCCD